MKQRLAIGSLVSLAIILGIAWLVRPVFHTAVMAVYKNPIWLLILLVIVPVAIVLLRPLFQPPKVSVVSGKHKSAEALQARVWLGFTLLGLSAVVMGVLGTLTNDIRYWLASKQTTYEAASALPEMNQNRLVPLPVAARFGLDSLQRSTERSFDWNPQYWNGQLSWVSALTPDGPFRYFTAKAPGIQVIDATSTDRDVKFVGQRMEISEGVGITDNIRWKLAKQRYFVDVPEVYYGQVDGKVVAVAPKLDYKGLFVRYPVPAGVFVVHADGRIEDLSREAAVNHPAVKSAGRAVPEVYARFVHETYAYRGGLLNKWFNHVDQPEIENPAGETNNQPYMLDTTNGLAWVSAANPWGKSAGIYKVFTTNALTGVTSLYNVPENTSLTGADQAIGYIRSAKPQYNWQSANAEGSSSGNIVAIEPRPQVVKGELQWMVSVTTSDAKGVQETCFVNAKNNNVNCFAKGSEAIAYAKSGSGAPATPADAPAPGQAPAPTAPSSDTAARLEKLKSLLDEANRELEALRQQQAAPTPSPTAAPAVQ